MKNTVWEYLDLMYDDATWPDSDPAVCVDSFWSDRKQALQDLIDAYGEVALAEEDSDIRDQLWEEGSEFPGCVAMVAAPQLMSKVILSGLQVIAKSHFDHVLDLFEASQGESRERLAYVIALHGLGSSESRAAKLMLAASAAEFSPGNDNLRSFAFQAFGKLERPSGRMIDTIARAAEDTSSPQPLRSVAIESLMDMGPVAAAAIPVLRAIKETDEDSDLRMFAWAALKSVSAESKDHPSGGTVAEHMRSLGHGVSEPEDE